MEILSLLYGTLLLRPYVFVFLAVYLAIAILNMGVKRSLIFTVLGYGIAFLAEYCSTRTGFPFGYYEYLETTRTQELWIANVPFMDSLSFSFLAYISYGMSLLLWSPLTREGWDVRLVDPAAIPGSWRILVTGAVLFMLLDVVIDPIAFLGDRWFLGQIYTYREAGEYFNIPLTNFAGWLLVGFTILFCFSRVNRWLTRRPGFVDHGMRDLPGQALLAPALYFSVLIFNLGVTFYIGEYRLGFCGLALTLSIFALTLLRARRSPDAEKKPDSTVIAE